MNSTNNGTPLGEGAFDWDDEFTVTLDDYDPNGTFDFDTVLRLTLDRPYSEKAAPIRKDINARPLTKFIILEREPQARHYTCPICGSPNSVCIISGTNRVKCLAHGCFDDKGRWQDTLGALRKIYPNLKEWQVFKLYGYDLNNMLIPETVTPVPAPTTAKPR